MSYLLCTYLKITVVLNVKFIVVNIFPFCQMNFKFYFFLIFKKRCRKRIFLKICILNNNFNFLALSFVKKVLDFRQ